jgi:hypothetical protein
MPDESTGRHDSLHCAPSYSDVADVKVVREEQRLPWDEVKRWVTHAQRIDSQRSPEEFARVKHQVDIRLVSDAAVAEAIKLTKQAVEYATTGRW